MPDTLLVSPAKRRKHCDPAKAGMIDKSRIIRQEAMTADEVLRAAAEEGLELVRAAEGKGKGKGNGSVSGYRGVVCMTNSHHNGKHYRAQVCIPNGGGTHVLGSFHSALEAALCVARNRHLALPENLIYPSPLEAEPLNSIPASPLSSQVSLPHGWSLANCSMADTSVVHDGWRPTTQEGSVIGVVAEETQTQAHAETLVLVAGSPVEVQMQEDGLRGAHFAAHVVSPRSRPHAAAAAAAAATAAARSRAQCGLAPVETVLVEYDCFEDEEGEPILEQVPLTQLRPIAPPPPASAQWLSTLPLGCPVELSLEGGWWQARLCGRRWRSDPSAGTAGSPEPQLELEVELNGYGIMKSAEHDMLRPCRLPFQRCAN